MDKNWWHPLAGIVVTLVVCIAAGLWSTGLANASLPSDNGGTAGTVYSGTLIVGKDLAPGTYLTHVAQDYFFGREDGGYCYVSRLNTATPDLGDVRTSYDHAPTGPILSDAAYREVGQRVVLKILPTDKAVEIDCGSVKWVKI